jgi:glucose-6-phosphate 1-dehydrogenase
MPRQRALSGTIPSMEVTHNEVKDNTIFVGQSSVASCTSRLTAFHPVLGASGDLAKKKVSATCGYRLCS